ncbi:hypothetical protein E2C01_009913 [Portunus trituberculatus]|uniref:Uncharacterized protein n=1 Tax=Portunus trituberculatus TaxID=210409 RepID=A0A5B7D6Z7_PORTR|nr:hypothetical protein [Portunus trituberculatus]
MSKAVHAKQPKCLETVLVPELRGVRGHSFVVCPEVVASQWYVCVPSQTLTDPLQPRYYNI